MVEFSGFDLSHTRDLTCHEGELVPVLCEEVLPNSTWKWNAENFMRLMPLVAPMNQQVDMFMHAWYVPNRLLFDGWEDFITGGKDGTDSQTWPYVTAPSGGFAVGSLADHLGFETGVTGLQVSAFPFRAYGLIYNTWYRDENLQSELAISKAAGSDTTTNTTLQRRNWKKDMVTGALPFAARGPQTYLPLGISAPVVGNGMALGMTNGTNNYGTTLDSSRILCNASVYGQPVSTTGASGASSVGVVGLTKDGEKSGVEADLTEASAVTVDDFNIAIQIRRFLQKNAIGGARYIECLMNHFDKRSSDARLQRPEFLGGGRCPTNISEVLQTSSTDATSPQGNMAGRGVAYMNTPHFLRNFEEHGWVIVLLSIMPKASYCQGLRRQFTRKTRLDYPWPVFAKMGFQKILNQEVAALPPTVVDSDGNPVNEGTYGYEPMYEECRHIPSTYHGQMKSTLAFWHQGRILDTNSQTQAVPLNSQVITCNPDKRVFAVTDPNEDECIVHINHTIHAILPLPKNGYPGPIGYMG